MTPSRRGTAIPRTRNFPPRRDPSHPVVPLPHFSAIKETIVTQFGNVEFVKTGYLFGYDLPFVFVYPCASPTFSPLRVLPSFPFLPPVLSSFTHLPSEVISRNIWISGTIREHRFPFSQVSSSLLFPCNSSYMIS